MAQFDVYLNPSKTSKAHYPYLVDIQSSLLSELATRIVIPLGKRSAFGGEAMQGLTPEISFADQELLLLTPQISSVSEKHLNNPIGSLSHFRDQIVGALDMAITGIYAYSRPRLPLIPDEACHPFHAKAATDSTAKLPPRQAA